MRWLLVVLLAFASACIDDALGQRRPRHRRFVAAAGGDSFPSRANTQSCDSGAGDALLTGAASKLWGVSD